MTLNTKSRTRSETMRWKIILVLFLLLLCQNLFSQFTWQRIYTSQIGGDEEAFDICQADNNNYYVVGITAPFFRKAYVIKINEFGDTLWTRTYFDGEIYTAAPTNDGGCIFAGYSGQAFACRINSDGDTIWVKRYNTINFLDIKKTSDNNYILCGANYSNEHYNGYACKIDINGNLVWEKVYPASNSIDFFTVEPATDNGFLLAGTIRGLPNSFRRSYLIKIDNNGDVVWEKNYKINTSDIVTGLQSIDNGYLIVGNSNGKLYSMIITISGDSIYSKVYENTNNIGPPSVLKENTNKFYIAHRNGETGSQSFIYSVDSNLNTKKQTSIFNSEGVSLLSSIKVQNSISRDLIFVGITALEPGNEEAYAIRIDSALTPPPPIGTSNNAIFIPTDNKLFQNYPNPFNPATMIKYVIPKDAVVKIKVYDILGKQVFGLDEFKKAGSYEVRFNGANLASGMYFYSVEANGFKETKKMVLLK